MFEKQLISQAFPSYLNQDAAILVNFLIKREACFEDVLGEERVVLRGESLIIPKRVYFGQYHTQSLTYLQEMMLNCLYLCHHNGFLREAYLRKVLQAKEDFTLPYITLLFGDYVYEILEVLAKSLSNKNKEKLRNFLAENPLFKKRIESRMVSYWDCYYRTLYPNLKEYIGYQLLKITNSSFIS